MILWLEVTQDKYELPLKVCDSVTTLARRCGVKPHTIYSCINKQERGYVKKSRYRKVVIEEGEEET